ncbi:MFS transporter [Rhizobium lusitanum]|uniref:MFS transporter n=1 Tax=Rhizobium lusitanum TaxID=293958 RepID=A0A6L9UFV1_9HYPH|nr:MFS transporter [Rhizobium lusitanum]NEI74875.1 MFS transporter [Rhizobium lusitanum]
MQTNAPIAPVPIPEGQHLRAVRHFFLLSIFLAAAGRNAYYVGATWILAIDGKAAGSIALFLALGSVVEFTASTPAGHLVDRFDRRFLCMASDLARILILLATSTTLVLGDADYALYGSIILYAIADRVYLIASSAIVPSIALPENLMSFNSLAYIAMQMGNLLAAAVAGWFLCAGSQMLCFLFAAGTFAGSALIMTRLPIGNFHFTGDRQHRSEDPSLYSSDVDRPPKAPFLLLVSYVLIYAMGMLTSALISKFVQLELSGGAIDFGNLEAYWAAGAIVSMLLLGRFRQADGRIIPIILVLAGMVMAGFHFTRSLDLALVLMAVLGASYNLVRVLVDVEVQRRVSNAKLGRVKGSMHVMCMGFSLALYAILAIVGQTIQPSATFLIFGGGMIVCAGLGFALKAAQKRCSFRRRTSQ